MFLLTYHCHQNHRGFCHTIQTSRSARGPASTQEREVEPFNPFAASSEPDVNPDHDQELDSRDDDMDKSQETSHLSHFMTVLGVNVQQEQLANELALVRCCTFPLILDHTPDQN
jgi:hypothetical protein